MAGLWVVWLVYGWFVGSLGSLWVVWIVFGWFEWFVSGSSFTAISLRQSVGVLSIIFKIIADLKLENVIIVEL